MSWSENQKQWYADNIDREREKRKQYSRQFRANFPEKKLLRAAKDRAKKFDLPCSVTIEDIVIPEMCPILQVQLKAGTRYAPSLDRFNPRLGYIKGNVWVISRKANVMKNDASFEELKEFARWVRKSKI